MNHEEFILKLKDFGFAITVNCPRGTSDFRLYLNGMEVNVKYYAYFGRYCGGAYCPVGIIDKEVYDENDFKLAIKAASEICIDAYSHLYRRVDYHNCKDYLRNYGKTKVDKDAIKRVLCILADNYQEIARNTKSFNRDDPFDE